MTYNIMMSVQEMRLLGRLVIDGNSVYEIDEACVQRKEQQDKRQEDRRKKKTEWHQPKRER